MTKTRQWIEHVAGLAAACGLALTVSSTAHAVAILHLDDGGGGHSINIMDGDGDGVISYTTAGGFGAWSFTVSTGFTKPDRGTATLPEMHLDVVANSKGAGVLNVAFTDTAFIGNGLSNFVTQVGGIVNTAAGGSSLTLGASLTAGGTDILASFGPFGPGAFSGTQSDSHLFGTAEGYLLSLFGHLAHTGSGVSSFDSDLRLVPEPGTLALLGVAFLLSGLFTRRRGKT